MTDSTLLSQTPARRMQGCIKEYERIRRRESTAFKTVRDFCICHRFSRLTAGSCPRASLSPIPGALITCLAG
ncbi:MAG: hypothetical protein LBB73_06740 [Dysgonamonadaceae bacterium]|jgi:hypothetical protein|nr:hypothetical protein [Dysgonamonadaceae bacterium]